MKIRKIISGMLGETYPLPEDTRATLLSAIDSLGDGLRIRLREETRAERMEDDEHSRALAMTHGIEFGAEIFHDEGTAGVLGFLTGLIMVAAQSVYWDKDARESLLRCMGEEDRLNSEELIQKVGFPGTVGETLMGLSQLVSNASYLSLLLTDDVSLPGDEEDEFNVSELDIRNAQPASDMPPAMREAALSEGKVILADEARASMEEKGLSVEEVMMMLKKAMTN